MIRIKSRMDMMIVNIANNINKIGFSFRAPIDPTKRRIQYKNGNQT